ncbi:hypothetical protein TNCV_1659101 [Trichonephila clavipes]|nr:hypothetical protein TNCV_1659101 [Trichonephila clavipes]
MPPSQYGGYDLRFVTNPDASRDSICMGKECVCICNEQTTCSEIVSNVSIRQTGCRMPQYDGERSVKLLNDRNHPGTNWRKDSKGSTVNVRAGTELW